MSVRVLSLAAPSNSKGYCPLGSKYVNNSDFGAESMELGPAVGYLEFPGTSTFVRRSAFLAILGTRAQEGSTTPSPQGLAWPKWAKLADIQLTPGVLDHVSLCFKPREGEPSLPNKP